LHQKNSGRIADLALEREGRCDYPPPACFSGEIAGGHAFVVAAWCPAKSVTIAWRGEFIYDQSRFGVFDWAAFSAKAAGQRAVWLRVVLMAGPSRLFAPLSFLVTVLIGALPVPFLYFLRVL
jgi:hypothetical protein